MQCSAFQHARPHITANLAMVSLQAHAFPAAYPQCRSLANAEASPHLSHQARQPPDSASALHRTLSSCALPSIWLEPGLDDLGQAAPVACWPAHTDGNGCTLGKHSQMVLWPADLLAGRKTVGTIKGTITFAGQRASKSFLRRYTGYVEQFGKSLGVPPAWSDVVSWSLSLIRRQLPAVTQAEHRGWSASM